MLVVMKTDFSHELKGFLAHFVTACGANLVVKNSGIINARNMGEWNTPYCNWTFTAENTGNLERYSFFFFGKYNTSFPFGFRSAYSIDIPGCAHDQ